MLQFLWMNSICSYSKGEWRCRLDSSDGGSLCCLHDSYFENQVEILQNLVLLSELDETQLMGYLLHNLDLSSHSSIKFSNKQFHYGSWSQSKFKSTFFTDCTFHNLLFEAINLDRCVFEEFYIKNCEFYDLHDSASNWIRGSLENVKSTSHKFYLEGSKIKNCLMSNCEWQNLHIFNCELQEVYFADCSIQEGYFSHCNFTDCKFKGNIGIMVLEDCNLTNCEFDNSENDFLVSKLNCKIYT